MGSFGNFIYRPSYGASGVSEYTNFDTGLVAIDDEVYRDQTHRQLTANAHGLVFTGSGSGGGLDSDKVDGLHASEMSGSSAFATCAATADWSVNSDKLDGLHSASFLLSGGNAQTATSASSADMLDGYHAAAFLLSGGTAQVALSASNSDMVDSYHAAAFLLSGGTAVAATSASDSDKLDGYHYQSFLLSGGNAQTATSASNADMLDGYHYQSFLLSGGTAQVALSASNSDMVDSYHAAAFLLSGDNAQTATSASNADMLDGYHATAFLLSGGTAQVALSASDSDKLDGYHATSFLLSGGTALSANDSTRLNGVLAAGYLLSGGTAVASLSASDSDKLDGYHYQSFLLSGGTAQTALSAGDSYTVGGNLPAAFLLSGGNAQTATSASNADMLDGYHAAAFLLSGGTAQVALSASNSDMLDSYHAASFLLSGDNAQTSTSASDSDKLDGLHSASFLLSGGTAQVALSASNSDMVDSYHAAAFLLSGGTAVAAMSASDSDMLDGYHAAAFLLSGGNAQTATSASSADMLDGYHAAAFLLSGGTAQTALSASNSDMIDGYHASQISGGAGTGDMKADGTVAFNGALSGTSAYFSNALSASSLYGTAQIALSASDSDKLDGYHATAFLLSGGTAQTTLSASDSDKVDGYHSSAFASSAHNTQHEAGGSDIIALDTLGAPTNITTLNATSSAHGLLPILDNSTIHYLRGDGTWQVPASGGIGNGDELSDGTIPFSNTLSGTSAYFSSSLSASSLYGTAQVALSASNADMLDTYHAASFLLSGGTAQTATSASDSDKLDGLHSASFLLSGGTAQVALSAGDSYTVGGNLPAAFLLSGGTAQVALSASNADMLDTYHAASFLLSGGTAQTATSASDSDKLDGYHAAAFLLSGGNAQTATSASNSDKLDGYHAASFVLSGGELWSRSSSLSAIYPTNIGDKVGIGTTTPISKLHVYDGSGPATVVIDSYDNSNPSVIKFIRANVDNEKMKIVTDYAGSGDFTTWTMSFYSNAINTLTLKDGYVGIGTTSPGSLLHLDATNPEISVRSNGGTGIAALNLYYGGGDDTSKNVTGTKLWYDVASAITYFDSKYPHTAGQQFGDIQFRIAPVTGGTEVPAVTIQSTGNVGIGTVSPLAKLHEYHGTTYASGDGIRSEGYYPNFQFYSTYPDAAQRNWAIISPWNTIGALEFKVSSAQYGDPINAGTTKFIIQSNGNVGIGTVSPANKLSVFGNIGIDRGDGNEHYIGNDGSQNLAFSAIGSIASIVFRTLNYPTERMRIDGATGNVGIGTVSPPTHLVVAKSGGGIIGLSNDVLGTYPSNMVVGSLRFLGNPTDASANLAMIRGYRGGTGYANQMQLEFLVGDGSNQALTIDKDGKVGIGTTEPNAKLEVKGTAVTSMTGTTYGQAIVGVGNYNANDMIALDFNVADKGGLGRIAVQSTSSGSKMLFGTSDIYGSGGTNVVTNTAMAIDPNGNVGVGTVSPAAKLTEYHGATYAAGDGIRSQGTYPNFQLYSEGASDDSRNWAIVNPWDINGSLSIRVSTAKAGDPINAGDTKLIISKAGNVGIGTVSPNVPLDFGTGAANKKIIVGIYTGGNYWTGIGADASVGLRLAGDPDVGAPYILTDIGFYSITAALADATWTSRMVVLNSGNVGIRTVSPSATLEVNGTTLLDGALSGTSAYFSSSLSASQLYGTVALASAATSAGNSYTVGGYLPAAFLLSGGTAVAATSASNSDMVDGLHASQISGGAGTGDMKADGTVAFSGMLSGTSAYFSSSLSASLLYGTAQVALSASNSDKLDGFHASELTAAGGTTVLYGTGSAPAASGYADGTVWIQYV